MANKPAAEPNYRLRKRTRPVETEREREKEDDASSLSSLSESDVSEHDPAADSHVESDDNFEEEVDEGSKKKKKKKGKKAPVKRTASAPVKAKGHQLPAQGPAASGSAPKLSSTNDQPFADSASRPYVHLRAAPLPEPSFSSSTPRLSHLFLRINELVQSSRIEAGRDEALQSASQLAVEKSIGGLPSAVHRFALCLIMNRYSSFCASPAVDIPAFPVTDNKVAIFLIRATATRIGASFRNLFPQPQTHPLPLSLGLDHTQLAKSEGHKVTRELVRSWIEALAYVQAATKVVWESQPAVKSPGPLLAQPTIEEVLVCFESGEFVVPTNGKGKEREGKSEEPGKKRTKWRKGGKNVDAPKKGSHSPPALPPMMLQNYSTATAGSPPHSLAPATPSLSNGSASTNDSWRGPALAQATYPSMGPPQYQQPSYYHSQSLPPPHSSSPYPFTSPQPQASTSHHAASLPIRPLGSSVDQHQHHQQQLHFQQQQYELEMQRRGQAPQGRSSTFPQHELQQYSLYATQPQPPQPHHHPSPQLQQQHLSPLSHEQFIESPDQERLPEPSRGEEGTGSEAGRRRSTRFKSNQPNGSSAGDAPEGSSEQGVEPTTAKESSSTFDPRENGDRQPSQAPEQVVPSHSDVVILPPISLRSSYPIDTRSSGSPVAASSLVEGQAAKPPRPKPRSNKNVYSNVLKADSRLTSNPGSPFPPPAFPLPASPAQSPSPTSPYPQSYPTYAQPHSSAYPSSYQQYWTTNVPPPNSYYSTPAPAPNMGYRANPYQSSYRTGAIPLTMASPHYGVPSSSSAYPTPTFSPHPPPQGISIAQGYETMSTSAYQVQSPRDGLGIDMGGATYVQGENGSALAEQESWAMQYSYGTPLSRESGEGSGER